MSGPIVRKYGFPNFEKIFGERPLEHGAEESEAQGPEPAPGASATSAETPSEPKHPAASKKSKK